MSIPLTFYTNPMSRGQIVRWMLEEVGVPYEQVLLEYGTTIKAPDYLAINPMGKVPAIRHGEKIVTECGAICAYLAEAFPEAGLAPTADERADYFRWMFFAAGPVEQAVTNRSLGFDVPPEKSMMAGYGSYDAVVDVLEKAVSNTDYICGSRFTAADVLIGSQILWGMQFGSLPKRAGFEPYAARLSSRPAFIRSKEIDMALMPQQG
jgi:glutathione S-transferase